MDLAGDTNRFTRAIEDFHDVTVPQLRAKFLAERDVDALLEHHARAFVLDELLESAGWITRPEGGDHLNMLTEAFAKPGGPKTRTLYLDYLGVDRLVNLPLLVVESKRFGAAGPHVLVGLYEKKLAARASSRRKAKVKTDPEEVMAAAMELPSWVTGEWRDHIAQLKKYVTATTNKFGQPPAVLAIGNGEWLVIIRDPGRVFSGQGDADCFEIIEEPGLRAGEGYRLHYGRIHSAIAYERLAPAAPYITPEAIPAELLQAKNVELLRGLHLGYTSTRTPQRRGIRPHIDVSPLVFLRLAPHPWLGVKVEGEGMNMPHEGKGSAALKMHLEEVQAASDGLVARVRKKFTDAPKEIDLIAYGHDHTAPAARPFVARDVLVAESSTRSYVILTGTKAHFILPEPRAKCPYHDWSACSSAAVGQFPSGGPVVAPSYSGNRAFFPNGRDHHCAADVTYRIKAQQLLAPNAAQTDERTLAEEVFCKIFDFESMLCCQTCVFFDVCKAAQRFKLPCIPS